MAEKSLLPKGYKQLGDKTRFLGELKSLSPAQQELRMLMVPDEKMKNGKDVARSTTPNLPKLKRLSDSISNNIQAQTNLRNITPYIKRAEQIWLTLLLKPNGLEQELLQYDTIDSDLKNAKLHSLLNQKTKNYFSSDYPFQDTLPQIIKDVMFRTGSYALLNLSHAALDHMINGMAKVEGTEALKSSVANIETNIKREFFVNGNYSKAKNFGWIRKEKQGSINDGLESIFANKGSGEEYNLVHDTLNWTFTDNPMILKVAELRNVLTESKLHNNMGVESLDSIIDTVFTKKEKGNNKPNPNNVGITSEEAYSDFIKRMYPNREYNQHESLSVRHEQYYTGSGRGVGVTFHVPSEACIPVHQNGNKHLPLGYIILVDPDNGNFLKTTGDINYYSSNKNRAEKVDRRNATGSLNEVISNIKNVAEGRDCEIDMDWVVEFVNGMLEKELTESFLNGDKAVPVTITLTEANKKLYLARAFKKQGVRSIFVPAEYMTYFALDYNDFGVGKSLVEEAKMIITRIAILDIADTAANLLNAISKSMLTIDIEEENFSPTELIIQAREKYLQENPSILNFVGFTDIPVDRIMDGIKESLVRIKVNSNGNPNIINPGFEETQDNREGLKPVDNDSREKALNSLSSFFDLKRSWLEDSEQGNDFAIEALADQELLRNITIERSRMFSLLVSDHFTKHINQNEFLIKELAELIMENKELYNKPDQGTNGFEVVGADGEKITVDETRKVKMVLKDYLNNLNVTLPLPASIETYNKLTEKLEAADKLVRGWREIGIAEALLKSILTEMGLEESNDTTSSTHVMDLINSVLRREAYKKLGISIPFDEVVADGKSGGMMTFISDATSQRENVITFIEKLFKDYSKSDKRIKQIAKRYKDGLNPPPGADDENNDELNNDGNNSGDNPGGDGSLNADDAAAQLDANNPVVEGGDDNQPTEEGGGNEGDANNNDDDNAGGGEPKTEDNQDGNTAENTEGKLNNGLDFGGNVTF